jgi:hypothetical protein
MVWEDSDAPYFQEVMPVETGRWGVLGVSFRLPMNSRENARRNLQRAGADTDTLRPRLLPSRTDLTCSITSLS